MSSVAGMIKLLSSGRFLDVGKTTLCVARRLAGSSHSGILPNVDAFQPKVKVDLNQQSFLIPGKERIRASLLTGDPYQLVTEIPNAKEIRTVYDAILFGKKKSNDGPCAGSLNKATGKFDWLRYSEVIERTEYIGTAFLKLGLEPRNTFVGLFASNRTEFLVTLFACAGYSMKLVLLYDSFGAENVHYINDEAKPKLVIANSNRSAMIILQRAKKTPFVETLVLMDPPSAEVKAACKDTSMRIMNFHELMDMGRTETKSPVLPEPEDLFCIPYTSGTTGRPKGVMLTHKNVVTCIASLAYSYGPGGRFGGKIISYLPAAHMYEIMNQVASLYFSRGVAFVVPDPKTLFDDIRTLKPEILPLVPRLMNAFYAKVITEAKSSKWKWYLFRLALSRKQKLLEKGIIGKNTIWDKTVFKKIQSALGGNAHIILTTSAPISKEVIKFFRCAAGCYIFEAYGQSEVLGATMTLPHESGGGFVGPPIPCNHIKLADVPEMNYFSEKDEGEICFRGPNVFQGYFNAPELTKECIDDEGWCHSGDIGRWLPNGALQIIDRKKHLFKMSQGEYIAPEKVENSYGRCEIVMQIYVDAFTDQDYIVAIVVPEPTNFTAWAKKKGHKLPLKELMENKDVRRDLLKKLHSFGKRSDLNSLEQARNVRLIMEPFSVDNGMLSHTLKVKRNEARKKFEPVLQEMYKEGKLIESLKE